MWLASQTSSNLTPSTGWTWAAFPLSTQLHPVPWRVIQDLCMKAAYSVGKGQASRVGEIPISSLSLSNQSSLWPIAARQTSLRDQPVPGKVPMRQRSLIKQPPHPPPSRFVITTSRYDDYNG